MKNAVFIAQSLDGYIAQMDGTINWLTEIPNPEGSDYGYTTFLASIDAIVMGRHTFEQVKEFESWPYGKPVVILSKTLHSVPKKLKDKASVSKATIPALLSSLHRKGYENLYIDGGKTIQSFLQLDLIDEMTITTVPLLLGKGIPLFGLLNQILRFKHEKTQSFQNGLVMSTYTRAITTEK
jgi:dihydrofolate reductase